MSELPEEPPAPPPPVASSARPESVRAFLRRTGLRPPRPEAAPAARRWLDKLDAGMANVPEAPVARGEGKTGGIPVRHWTNEGPAKPGDFAPAVAPERSAAFGKHLGELEARVRGSGRPGVGFGKETEASMMFGGTGDAAGEPIPAWIREMIRKRVRDRLPELEGVYTDAIRRNPDLRGKIARPVPHRPFREGPERRTGRRVLPRRRVRERRPRQGPPLDLRAAGGTHRGSSLPLRVRRPVVKGQKTPGIRR